MRTSVGRRMAEKTMNARCEQAVKEHYAKKNYYCERCEDRFTYDQVSISLSREAVCPVCDGDLEYQELPTAQAVAQQVSRSFLKCEAGNCGEYADAEYKLNGVGSSIYLCDECFANGGDLDVHELLELIKRLND